MCSHKRDPKNLSLDNLSQQDSGEVICRAENSFGTAEQTAYIYVRPGK